MTFKKPKNVKYVDMCIYVDKKVQGEQPLSDEEASLVYEYLYHIIYMLAVKHRYFSKEEYYDEFALLTAGDVFNRLFANPKLFELNEDGSPKLTKIKSCLNYIKAILYGRKVHFEQTYYSQKYTEIETEDTLPISSFSYTRDNFDFKINLNTDLYLSSISKTIKTYIQNNTPYRKNKLLLKNIYLSCLFSILNSLVFTEQEANNIQNKYTTIDAKTRYLYKAYKLNRENSIILYHLPNYYKSYITVLVRQLYTVIGKDIKEICRTDISIPEDVLMNISFMEIMTNDDDD